MKAEVTDDKREVKKKKGVAVRVRDLRRLSTFNKSLWGLVLSSPSGY